MFSKKIIAGVILAGFLTGYIITPPKDPAEAAIYVTDTQNIAQNTQTAINTAANAVNTANQVALSVRNLTSMDSKALLAHYLGLDKQYQKLMNYLDEQVGALDKTTSTDTVLSEMGSNGTLYNTKMNADDYKNAVKKLYHIEDDTYASALKVAKQQQQIEDGIESLENALKKLNTAQGQKEAQQAQGQIASQGVIEQNKMNTALTTLVGIISTKNLSEIAQKQAQMKKNEETIADMKTNAENVINEVNDNAEHNWNSYQDIINGR
ncbi:hypothetical protein [Megamonas hypermegale]|uniref:hypothetical protein n=1 Tax=Megamonas hypermegale TaxID=158847 RepID=UPI00242C6699|nr:hypothetical protein [Megamonas hypermegale]